MEDYLTEREKELQDFRCGKSKYNKNRMRKKLAQRTREAPHELITIFRLFGKQHSIPEKEMLRLMEWIKTIKSRQLVQTVFKSAFNHWKAYLEEEHERK